MDKISAIFKIRSNVLLPEQISTDIYILDYQRDLFLEAKDRFGDFRKEAGSLFFIIFTMICK